jgi:small subunit ribosomal protein S16
LKHHLDGGVRKGALTQEQADAKLATWLDAKAGKVDAKKDGLSKAQADAKAKAFKAEQAANEKRIAAIADAAKAEEVVEAAAEVTEEVAEEVVEAAAEVTEEVAVEEVVEAVAEETTEAPAAEENNEEKEA